ncbi:hypothetical protein [Paraburkholderia sp. J41]|uniref:hypothetical protein n=1 Tax=Paraburkholderia sp. J41 TaxID=2805433 RepID=UPI002AC36933|nr:hypothetical protein [Paraburkholderia sp. J41]
MNVGFRAWDANGTLIFDLSYRLARIIDSRKLDGTGGSLVDDRLTQGGWVAFQPDFSCGDGYLSGGVIVPQFSISGNVLSWSYAAKNSAQYDIYQTGTLFYGAS